MRDARGRFVAAPKPEVVEPDGYSAAPGEPLTPGELAVLRDLPEIAGIACPGEELGGVVCEEGHHLVLFWPLLCQGKHSYFEKERYVWDLGAPTLYDIDLSVPSDRGENSHAGDKYHNHMAHPVRMRMGENGEYKGTGWHTTTFDNYGSYDRNAGLDGRPGSLCRGNARFTNNPFQCTLMLRMWHVQTQEGKSAVVDGYRESPHKWWVEKGDAFMERYPFAKVIVVPSDAVNVHAARFIPLERALVERVRAKDWCAPYPYSEVKEAVKEVVKPST